MDFACFKSKRLRIGVLVLAALCAAVASAQEEGVVSKVEHSIDKGARATAESVEKGAAAADKGIRKGLDVANEKVFKKADNWIQDKVNKKGSSAPGGGDK